MDDIILILILAILAIYVLLAYNKLVRLKNSVRNSSSVINVYLKQRFDLIPNLVEIVKGYVKHEKEVFEQIAFLREVAGYNMHAANELNMEFTKLYAVAENYPELKASEQFLNLQHSLVKMENQLQAARRAYNMDVKTFNTALEVFPLSVVAALFRFRKEELFKSDDDINSNVKVSI